MVRSWGSSSHFGETAEKPIKTQQREQIKKEGTSHNQLGGEVDRGRLVGGDAGVGAAVGGAEGEEEDVAAEDVILHLVAG